MKAAVSISRILVGVLFIISGLVKANDPLGLSYKMQEFFEVWNTGLAKSGGALSGTLISFFSFLHEHSLSLSILMNGLEILAGVALLIGWKPKLVTSLLLALILFFTFLTAYALWSGKFKNCGCFGDCLPISPMASFLKDLILLVLIGFLFLKRKYIQTSLSSRTQALILTLALVATAGLQWYVLEKLPFVDCLPLKKGNDITEQMKIPANAIQDSFAMKFIYKREGRQFEFGVDELPADLDKYEFVERQQELIRKGNAEPPLKSFTLTAVDGTDFTSTILAEPKVALVFLHHFNGLNEWMPYFRDLYAAVKQKNIPIFVVSGAASRGTVIFSSMNMADVVMLNCDQTAIRTAARTNPTFYLIEKGKVIDKGSYHRTDEIIQKL